MLVDKNFVPHASHIMGDWKNSVVTLIETARFGSVRCCVNCGAEHARTVCGAAAHDELVIKCESI